MHCRTMSLSYKASVTNQIKRTKFLLCICVQVIALIATFACLFSFEHDAF